MYACVCVCHFVCLCIFSVNKQQNTADEEDESDLPQVTQYVTDC